MTEPRPSSQPSVSQLGPREPLLESGERSIPGLGAGAAARRGRAGLSPQSRTQHAAFAPAVTVGAPPAHDLRNVGGQNYVTPVRDQGSCKASVAFAVAAVLEASLRVARNDPGLDVDLSEAQLFHVYGRRRGATCQIGWSPDEALDDCRDKGLGFEADYPYTDGDEAGAGIASKPTRRYVKIAQRRRLSGARIKKWIATHGPVTACMAVYEDFEAYTGGVYFHRAGDCVGAQCVALVGYDDDAFVRDDDPTHEPIKGCWIAKNSRGPNWGEAGFFRIAYGECGIDSWAGPYGVEGVTLVVLPDKRWSSWTSEGGVITSEPTVATNADRRLELFARAVDGAVQHKWQTAPNGRWSEWSSLGGASLSSLAAGRNQDGRLEIFVRDASNTLQHAWQVAPGGNWSGWQAERGVSVNSEIALAQNVDGRLEVFVRGADNALWHKWQTAASGGWSDWASRGGVLTGNLAVGRNADGRLEVFARGTASTVVHKWQDPAPGKGWSDWCSEGGVVTSDVAVGRNADGRLELFARGLDNSLWHKSQTEPDGGWSSWVSEGNFIASNVAVAYSPDGRLHVIARGANNALSHKCQTTPNGEWSDWEVIEPLRFGSDVAAAVSPDGRLEVFVRGTDGALWRVAQLAA